jgi:hypothetical protein
VFAQSKEGEVSLGIVTAEVASKRLSAHVATTPTFRVKRWSALGLVLRVHSWKELLVSPFAGDGYCDSGQSMIWATTQSTKRNAISRTAHSLASRIRVLPFLVPIQSLATVRYAHPSWAAAATM